MGMKLLKMTTAISLSVVLSAVMFKFVSYAENNITEGVGKLYEFNDSKYEISSAEEGLSTFDNDTYGKFLIDGNIVATTEKDGIPVYEISDGNLDFIYEYTDTMLNADIDSWHLIEDNTDTIDGKRIDGGIKKGVILLQTSMDRKNWIDSVCVTDAFNATPINSDAFYTTRDIELINGCYYKLTVAYEKRIRTEDSNFLFIDTDKFEYKKCAEVYEFYAFIDNEEYENDDCAESYNLGNKVRVKNFDGYYGEEEIGEDDNHYGWELGNFFVSGYTDKRTEEDNVVFLKNPGDKVTLWFNLKQSIDKIQLPNKDNQFVSITADTEGYDQYFETPRIDFGKGVLIIRHTDYRNNKSEPQIYTNYLEANAVFGADTKVQLFEEGDYEVALNYQVTKDEFIDKIGHYRIFFKFSVRNGNCMVYPFDVATGSELTNSSMTENGFRLDLAKSRYLNVNIKREVLKDSADGLVEDTRFNGPAKDGAEYTDEGIYTITVGNNYTNQFTVKKIYVGTNNILRAYMATGLSIPEINNLVAEGATIMEDGTIKLAEKVVETTDTVNETTAETNAVIDAMAEVDAEKADNSASPVVILIIVGVVVIAVILFAIIIFKKKANHNSENVSNDREGGAEE